MRYVGSPATTTAGQNRRVYSTVEGNATNGQTVFDVTYEQGRVDAFLGGVRLVPDRDFTRTANGIGTSITLITGISTGDYLELVGHLGTAGNAISTFNYVVGTSSGSYAGSTTVFPVTHNSGDKVNFYLNGVLLDSTDYSTSPSTGEVTLATAAATGDYVEVQVIGSLVSSSDATFASVTAGQLTSDNIQIDGNTISSTDTDGNINLSPNGNGSAVVTSAGTGDALRITQTGTGNALVVEDSSPDSTPFVVNATGKVGIGTETPSEELEISSNTPAIKLSDTDESDSYGTMSMASSVMYLQANGASSDGQLVYRSGNAGTFTERMRIDSSGNVELKTTNAKLILPSGGGIDFGTSTTGTGTVTPTVGGLLDDYEEGTWIPQLEVYSGSVSYPSRQDGWYRKVGKLVFIAANVVGNSSVSNTLLYLKNLPFNVGSTSGMYPGPTISNAYNVSLGTGGTVLGGYWDNGFSKMRFHTYGNGTSQMSATVSAGVDFEIRMTGFYST